MNYILTAIAAIAISLGSFFTLNHQPTQNLGSTFSPTGGGTYRLQSSIGGSATSLTLSSFKEPISNIKYTMSYLNSSIEYATIEPQSNNKEFVSFSGITQNADGTATLTGLSRGLGFSYPYTASTTLQQPHSGQSILILSNPPQLYNQYGALANAQTWAGINTFSSTSQPVYDGAPSFTNGLSLIDKTYADALAIAGAPNALVGTKGIVDIATALQAASSSQVGVTSSIRVLPAGIATDTPNVGTSNSLVVMSDLLGNVWKSVVANLGLANTFTKANTFTATSTFSGSVISTETTLATSTSMTIDWSKGNKQLIRNGTAALTVAFSDVSVGQSLTLTICNPSSTGGAVTFSGANILWPGATPPTTTTVANKCDLISFNASNGTSTPIVMGGFNLNY